MSGATITKFRVRMAGSFTRLSKKFDPEGALIVCPAKDAETFTRQSEAESAIKRTYAARDAAKASYIADWDVFKPLTQMKGLIVETFQAPAPAERQKPETLDFSS